MYVLEITQSEKPWIAAISPDKDAIDSYCETMPTNLRVQASVYTITTGSFPLIIIEHIDAPQKSGAYFEFCTTEALQLRFETLRLQKMNEEEHVYFRYYFIDEAYFQSPSDQNYMRYLRHTMVTNDILDDPYPISVFHEQIGKYVSNYDIEGLDHLFELTKTRYTSWLQKKDLAVNGYESLLWQMQYDHACGKLTETGIGYLMPMVCKMEILSGETKWQHRSHVLHILLEKACENKSENTVLLLHETIEAFENYRVSHPEEILETHRLLSIAFRQIMEADTGNAMSYWQQAVSEIKKAVRIAPAKASWATLFELLYTPFAEDEKIKTVQKELQEQLTAELNVLEDESGVAIAYPVALAYQNLREYWEWKKIKDAFPEAEYAYWTGKTLTYNPEEISRLDLHESTYFFHKVGAIQRRTDFLQKAINLHERVLSSIADSVFEVYSIASLWKETAEIHLEKGDASLADQAIIQAQEIYRKHLEQVKSNPSTYLHYTEFLEYCFFNYPGNIEKPSLEELKTIASEVEIQSEGFLSYPYLLLMKIALHENNEAQAVLELTKSLILHELCNDSVYEELWKNFKDSNYKQLSIFLYDTIQFIGEIGENYYYHPELHWKQVRAMTAGELTGYWEKRKNELRNRAVTASE